MLFVGTITQLDMPPINGHDARQRRLDDALEAANQC